MTNKREIKFRGQVINNSKWVYGDYFKRTTEDGGIEYIIRQYSFVDNFIGYTDYVIDENTIGQYTRLKDKNEVEIYEGDILSYSTKVKEKGKVQFNSVRAQFEVFWTFDDINAMDSYWTSHELEVIGNIYSNPELNY
jgi:uncharacterized phage protein (TIGR01671 family)